jgi:type I restriction enzyme M protein
VLRRLDCVLAPTKQAVLVAAEKSLPDPILTRAAENTFFNRSPLDLVKLIGDQDNIATNLLSYIQGFSPEVRDIFEQFEFAAQIDRLANNGLLYQVTERFAGIDLHPDRVDNNQMGLVFEELIRKFAEISNETAGEHFTPREVIRLMVNLIFVEDDDVLSKPSVVRSIYDPTAGTGGMLSIAGEYLHEHNPQAQLTMSGQELNPESYAICKADMLIKGQDINKIVQGNTLSDDGHPAQTFDYMLSNPPFGVEWKKVQKDVQDEHQRLGFAGRFGPGLPRVSDGSLLFLMHLLAKMRPHAEGGCRFGIVLNGSPLFTGGAGMHQRCRCGERHAEPFLASGQTQCEGSVGFARAARPQRDDIAPLFDPFPTCQFQHQRLVERWLGGKIEGVEALGVREPSHADTALDHPALAVNPLKRGMGAACLPFGLAASF